MTQNRTELPSTEADADMRLLRERTVMNLSELYALVESLASSTSNSEGTLLDSFYTEERRFLRRARSIARSDILWSIETEIGRLKRLTKQAQKMKDNHSDRQMEEHDALLIGRRAIALAKARHISDSLVRFRARKDSAIRSILDGISEIQSYPIRPFTEESDANEYLGILLMHDEAYRKVSVTAWADAHPSADETLAMVEWDDMLDELAKLKSQVQRLCYISATRMMRGDFKLRLRQCRAWVDVSPDYLEMLEGMATMLRPSLSTRARRWYQRTEIRVLTTGELGSLKVLRKQIESSIVPRLRTLSRAVAVDKEVSGEA